MIPKVIHYCWFSGEEMSSFIKRCISTWKKYLPDYELKLWDANSFDFSSVPFVAEAYQAKKWAFVTDYVRLYALYTEGGIYLDSDVRVMKSFDRFLKYSFFTSQEYHPDMFLPVKGEVVDEQGKRLKESVSGMGIQAAVLGAEKGCPYLKDCLDYYATIHFNVERKNDFIIVGLIARLMEKYGYRYVLEEQYLEEYNMMILPPYVFSGMTTLTDDSYAIHLYNGSWCDSSAGVKHRLRNRFPVVYSWIQKLYYKLSGIYR